MSTPSHLALSFLLFILLNSAVQAWPNIRTSFIVGTGYTITSEAQSIWLYNTPEPGLQNTYVSDGHEHGTYLLGLALENPVTTTIKNLESAIGIELDYLKNSSIRGIVHPIVNLDPNFDRLDYAYNLSSYLLFVTGKLIQSNIFHNIGAYINAGAGLVYNRLSNYTETTPPGSSTAPMLAPFRDKSNTNFAFTFGAGILWQIDKTSSFLIGYRYINAGHASLNTSPIQQTNSTLKFSPCHHLLTFGLSV